MEVLFEDNHLIIVNKKSSEIVQGDKTGDQTLAEKVGAFLKHKYNKPGNVFVGVVHRLDRPVSGVIVFAKTSKALTRMNELFKTRNVTKTYWAISENVPVKLEDTLVHYLVKDEKKNKTTPHHKEVTNSKRAELKYKLLSKNKVSLIEVEPLTGRPHQIRVQLAAIKCPIKGDVKYGAKTPNPDLSICLHARKLVFTHPVSKELISIEAPLPNKDFWKY